MDTAQVTENEKRLLNALMLQGGVKVAEAAEILSAGDFYRPEHRIIYSALLRLFYASRPIDFKIVENELHKSGELKRITREYFKSLTELEYTAAKAEYYAQEVLEASRKRRLQELGRILTEGKGTSEEILSRTEKHLTELTANKKSAAQSAEEVAGETLDEILKRKGGLVGRSTGFIDLDRLTGGLKKSDLIILAARPSMGKTALGMNIAAEVANSAAVGVFSLEMSKGQLMERMLSSAANVNAGRIQRGDLRDTEKQALMEAANYIAKKKLFIDDTGALSLRELQVRARRLKRDRELELIVVDYLQLMQASNEYRGNRVQEVSEISRGLKSLAKELDIPVLALSQLSRAVEQRADKKPLLSDLRESGSIEQDADIVMFLYREEYYNHEEENIAEVTIAKNRNGATGTTKLFFDKPTVTFRNLFNGGKL